MKIWRATILVIVFAVLGLGVYDLWQENDNLEERVNNVSEDLSSLKQENRDLRAQIDYFQEPENLIEEAKKNFNYRKSGENMMIIVPEDNSGDSSQSEE